jgi:hypothetical protein
MIYHLARTKPQASRRRSLGQTDPSAWVRTSRTQNCPEVPRVTGRAADLAEASTSPTHLLFRIDDCAGQDLPAEGKAQIRNSPARRRWLL